MDEVHLAITVDVYQDEACGVGAEGGGAGEGKINLSPFLIGHLF